MQVDELHIYLYIADGATRARMSLFSYCLKIVR